MRARKSTNGKVRTITDGRTGLHGASALIALIHLCCSGLSGGPALPNPGLRPESRGSIEGKVQSLARERHADARATSSRLLAVDEGGDRDQTRLIAADIQANCKTLLDSERARPPPIVEARDG
jgi:hypothetical protein